MSETEPFFGAVNENAEAIARSMRSEEEEETEAEPEAVFSVREETGVTEVSAERFFFRLWTGAEGF